MKVMLCAPADGQLTPQTCVEARTLPPHFPEDCIVTLFFVAGVDISSSASWRNPSLNALPWGFPQELAIVKHKENILTFQTYNTNKFQFKGQFWCYCFMPVLVNVYTSSAVVWRCGTELQGILINFLPFSFVQFIWSTSSSVKETNVITETVI